MSAETKQGALYGLLTEFESPSLLMEAVEKVRDAGFKKWDVHTPFPVHGMDRAMGLRSTKLPWLVLGGGITGCAGAILLQWWTNAVDYPFLIRQRCRENGAKDGKTSEKKPQRRVQSEGRIGGTEGR